MKHLNLELQKLEERTAPGLLPSLPIIGGGGDSYSNGSKSNSNGSKSGGSKSS